MGAGRKTQTTTYDSARRVPVRFRELGQERLAGVIFGCTKDTIRECLTGCVFGLPQIHIQYVQWIEPGMPIFLFNYSDRKLHGVFQAVTEGNTNINPHGWTGGRSTPTAYPAQVEVKRIAEPPPLAEEEFQPIIIDNYYTDKHFMFELDAQQVEWLHNAFRKRTPQSARMASSTSASAAHVPKSAPTPSTPAVAPVAIANGQVKPATPKPMNAWVKRAQAEPSTSTNGNPRLASPPSLQLAEPAASNIKPQTPPAADYLLDYPESNKPSSSSKSSTTPADHAQRSDTDKLAQSTSHMKTETHRPASSDANVKPSSALAQKEATSAPLATNNTSTALRPSSSPPSPPAAIERVDSTSDVDTQPKAADTQEPVPGLHVPAPIVTGNVSIGSNTEPKTADTHKPSPYMPASLSTGDASAASTSASASSANARIQSPSDAPASDTTSVPKPLSPAELTDSTATSHISAVPAVAQPLQLKANLSETQAVMQRAAAEQMMLQRERGSTQMDAAASSACLQKHLQMCAAAIAQVREETIRAVRAREGSELYALQAEVAALRAAQARTDAELAALRSELALLRGIPPAMNFLHSTNVSLPIGSSQPPHEDMYIVGGFGAQQKTWLSSVARYSPANGEWEDCASLTAGRGYCGAVAVKQHVYVCGGGNGGPYLGSVERYDTREDCWLTLPSLSVPRGSLAAAADADGRVYALGGGNATQHFSVVERFDPELGEWMLAKSMSERRFSVSAATVGHCIFALGGFNGSIYQKSVERLDPREGSWTSVPDMLEARGSAAVAVVGDYIYAVGGFNGAEFLKSVEVYDLRKNLWYPLAPAQIPRAHCAVGVIKHDIYVLGGMSGGLSTGTAEKYEISQNAWSYVDLPANASSERSFVAAAVVADRC